VTTPSNSVAATTLAKFIEDNFTELEQVLDEWPDPKVAMNLPSVSVITVGTPVYTHLMPTKYAVVDTDNPLQKSVVYLVGQFDAKIQLDLWTDYKATRDTLFDKLMDVLNKQFIDTGAPTGLSLTLIDYHNAIARYDQVGYTYMDSEESSRTEEWRVKVDIEVNYPKFQVKDESIIEEASILHDVGEESDPNTADINETFEVF
jgi:hypothetical protein